MVGNSENDEWELCVLDEEENCDKWVCAIQGVLGNYRIYLLKGKPCPEEP